MRGRDEAGRFCPGRSGNPGGRPKGLAIAVRETLRHKVGEGEDPAIALARFFASVAFDETAKLELRMRAADWLADRGWGKSPGAAQVEGDDPSPLTDTDAAIKKLMDELRGGPPPAREGVQQPGEV